MLARKKRAAAVLSMATVLMLSAPFVVAAQNSTTVIHVDDAAAPGGNGTGGFPFHNLPEAVEAARTVPGRVIIKVEPGDYPLASTLVINRALDLQGATQQLAGLDHWRTGQVVPGTATRVFATNQALTQVVLVDSGSVLGDVNIKVFIFEGTNPQDGGTSLELRRVQSYVIANNVFRGPATLGFVSVASSGTVLSNHFSGVGTGAILYGGFSTLNVNSPSKVVFQANRAVRNNTGGLLLGGRSTNIPEMRDPEMKPLLDVVVRDNDLSENTISTVNGFGIRAYIHGPGAPEGNEEDEIAADVIGFVQNNRIVGNRVGIVIDAGFAYRKFPPTTDGVCVKPEFSGTHDFTFVGNTLSGSIMPRQALITTGRQQAVLMPTPLMQASYKYLHKATFTITDRDGILLNAMVDHQAMDPFLGPCPTDATNEVLGNKLMYNGAELTKGRNF
jgi:hypothetical protein